MTENTPNMKFGHWKEQELPFADESRQETEESRQEAIEPIAEFSKEQPDVRNPISLPWENEQRLVEPDNDNF